MMYASSVSQTSSKLDFLPRLKSWVIQPVDYLGCELAGSLTLVWSVAATAVALHTEISIEEAFELIGEQRDEFDAHPALVRQAVSVSRACPK